MDRKPNRDGGFQVLSSRSLPLRVVIALLLPFAALALQKLLWPIVYPYVWFLFYPAAFAAAWFGGRTAGILATLLSAAFVWFFFMEPQGVLVKDQAKHYFAVFIFIGLGYLFSLVQERLRQETVKANQVFGRMRDLVELAPDGIFIADLDGRYTDVNAAGCRMLGYEADEIIGKTIVDFIPPNEVERLKQSRMELLHGQPSVEEWHLRRKDGKYVPVEVNAKILADGRWQGFVRDISARKQMELALAEREADLNRAQTVAHIGSWRLDVHRNELRWSDEAYRLFGIPAGRRMTYEAFLGCIHPEDLPFVDEQWTAALQGAPYDIEHRIIVNGEVRWVREKAELYYNAQGALVGGIGISQDITEHKHAEKALQNAHETERRLRGELEDMMHSSKAISESVAKLPVSDISAVLHMIALQAQNLTQAEYVALGMGADPDQPFEPWVYIGMSEETAKNIGRNPRPVGTFSQVAHDGKILRLKEVSRHPAFRGLPPGHPPIHSFLGVPINFRGVSMGNLYLGNKQGADEFSVQDERRVLLLASLAGVAIETATRYVGEAVQRAWLQSFIDQMPEAVVFLDEQGEFLLQNKMAQALRRPNTAGIYGPKGMTIPFDVRYADGQTVPASELPLFKALNEGKSISGVDLVIVGPESKWVPVLISATPMRVHGKIVGAVGVFQDVSMLKELERLREEWASIIAHDLRQPVSVISLTAQMLPSIHNGALSERERQAFERILAASMRLKRMVNDLFDASLIESRRLDIAKRNTDMDELIREVVEEMYGVLAGYKIRIESVEVEAAIDPDRMRQVLVNLLSNAAKYGTPGTEICIEMRLREGEIEVLVTNHGPGIPPDQLPLLFQRFARMDGTREGKFQGTGLGLYIARGLVEAHGGRIWGESIPNEKTTFHFALPWRHATEPSAESYSLSPEHPPGP